MLFGWMVAKNGTVDGRWRTRNMTFLFGCGLWSIMRDGKSSVPIIIFKMTDGNRISFW